MRINLCAVLAFQAGFPRGVCGFGPQIDGDRHAARRISQRWAGRCVASKMLGGAQHSLVLAQCLIMQTHSNASYLKTRQ